MATGSVQPFNPAGTVSIAATTASQSVAAPVAPAPSGIGGPTEVVVYNSGTTVAFVAFGSVAPTATIAGGYPIPPGASRIISVGYVAQFAAAVLLSGAGTIYFSWGAGSAF